ncbi:MAG TPA: choline/ethanolamine kinase family protein, partial [Mycobacteriales bacterium]
MPASADLAALLDRLPSLAGHPRTVTPLAGGLSNHSYRVTTPTLTAVLRLPAGDAGLLGVDREHEYRNTVAAHAAGVGPPVLDRLGDVTVIGWLPGRTLTAADLHDPAVLARVVTACRVLHGGPRFAGEVDLVAVQRRYRALCAEHGFAVPPRYDDHQRTVQRLAAALAATPEPAVPCHNDLLPANILDTGERVSFVDYEYSANSDPCSELGTLAGGAALDAEEVVERYYGRPRPSRAARARLYTVLGHHTWALWAAVRAGTGDLDVDLGAWGREQYERSAAALTSAVLPSLLDAAARTD